jgi:hypothetical protein
MRLLISAALLLTLTGVVRAEEPKIYEAANEKEARDKAGEIMFAAQLYKKENNTWPDKLMDLMKIVKNKEELLDPWGKDYQFSVVEGKVYVWTERTVGKETKVYGVKPGKDGPAMLEEFQTEQMAEVGVVYLQLSAELQRLQDKKLPATLDELIAKIAERRKDAEKAAIDPWGKKYQYKLVKDKVYVWTERTVDKETRVYGTKPPEEKKEDKKPADKKQQ